MPLFRPVPLQGNIVTGNDQQTQIVLDCGFLRSCQQLIRSGTQSIRKEVCWSISNITAGTRSQIQAVLDVDILPAIIK